MFLEVETDEKMMKMFFQSVVHVWLINVVLSWWLNWVSWLLRHI